MDISARAKETGQRADTPEVVREKRRAMDTSDSEGEEEQGKKKRRKKVSSSTLRRRMVGGPGVIRAREARSDNWALAHILPLLSLIYPSL